MSCDGVGFTFSNVISFQNAQNYLSSINVQYILSQDGRLIIYVKNVDLNRINFNILGSFPSICVSLPTVSVPQLFPIYTQPQVFVSSPIFYPPIEYIYPRFERFPILEPRFPRRFHMRSPNRGRGRGRR